MDKKLLELKNTAKRVRRDIVSMIHAAKSGHPGGSLSCVEILVSIYDIMNFEKDSNGNRIDRFILSKGHAAPAYYAILAQKGFIDHETLLTLRKIDGNLEGHPSNKINGVDVSSGSLGQGLSVANGIAISKKLNNNPGRVYCLCGDGEIEEGQVWEAMMTANKYNLNNLTLVIDKNDLQIDGTTKDVKKLDNLDEKIRSFGFNVLNVNGHNLEELIEALQDSIKSDIPTCIIANTIKGKGVSFMENKVEWHGKSLSDEELQMSLKELMGD